MKKLFLPLFAIAAVLPAIGQGIVFEDLTLEQAVAKAGTENKYIFADVYTNWCGPCKMMDAQVFTMPEVGEYFNPKYVNLKFNAEDQGEGTAFADKFNVKAYPTFVILDSNGDLLHMFAGGILSLEFIDKVEESFDPSVAYGQLKRRYDAGERDPRFMGSYLEALQNTHSVRMDDLIEEFYNSTSDQDKICAECLFIFDNARVWSDKDEFVTVNRDRYREVAGREKVDAMFKRKYSGWYGQVIMGYDTGADVQKIEETNRRLASLDLSDTAIFPVLQAAAVAKVTGEGAPQVFEMTKQAVFPMEDSDRDTILYHVTIGLKDLLTDAQKDDLLELVTSDSTKGYITRSIGRQ